MKRRTGVIFLAAVAAVTLCGTAPPATGAPGQVVITTPDKAPPGKTSSVLSYNRCAADYDVTGPDGKIYRTTEASVGATGSGIISLRMHFAGQLPDPDLISSSHHDMTLRLGELVVSARQASHADFRFEKAGDAGPVYMREATVLRLGKTWFVGDSVDFFAQARVIDIGVDADFMDRFQNVRTFEMWWKGARRMTFRIIPSHMSPEAFSAECLPVPASIRAQVEKARSNAVLRRLQPSATPRLLGFISLADTGHLNSNPFYNDDSSAGSATFRITVGRGGLVKQCDLTDRTGKVPERPAACEIVRRWACFYPATDKAGMPAETETMFALDWKAKQ